MYIASKVLKLRDGSTVMVYAEGVGAHTPGDDFDVTTDAHKMTWYCRVEDAVERMRVIVYVSKDLRTISPDADLAMDDFVAFLQSDAEEYEAELERYRQSDAESWDESDYTTSRSAARWCSEHSMELAALNDVSSWTDA